MTSQRVHFPTVSTIGADVKQLGYTSSERGTERLRSISNQLWLSVGIAFLILAPVQWFLLR